MREQIINTLKINVLVLSRLRSRLIATVMSHVHSARFAFSVVDEASGLVPDIALVEFGDSETQARLVNLIERHPAMQIVQLVTAKDEIGGHRYQIFGAHLVSDLIPMLERVAGNLGATNSLRLSPQLAPPVAAPTAAQPTPAPMPAHVPAQPPAPPALQAAPPVAPHAMQRAAPPMRQILPQIVEANVVRLPTRVQPERLRALVVDDSPTVRQQLALIVDRLGLRCDTAESGAEALALLEHNVYNIIYVDVVMPDMDGYRLTRDIKRNRAHKAIPVIILTSKSSPFDRARGALAGCDTYLTKPVELKRFFEATRSCLLKNRAVVDSHDWINDPSLPPLSAAPARSPAIGVSAAGQADNATRPEFTGLRMGGLYPNEA